jgi:hypothetical protein
MVTSANANHALLPRVRSLGEEAAPDHGLGAAVPLVTFALVLGGYIPTLLPGVGFWDTAEFQTVGPVLGIAHPTGFPTYTLLGWLASVVLWPAGETAYRLNLLSAILVAGAAAFLALASHRALRRPLLAAGAGFLLAVSPITWWTATRADAHALHVFLLAVLLERLVTWAQAVRAGSEGAHRPLLAASLVYGVSLGNHALTVLLAPGIAAFVLAVQPSIFRRWRLVLSCAGIIALTILALYAYIPIRAAMGPPLNYAHPSSLQGFLYLVSAAQFHGLLGDPFARGLGPIVQVFVVQAGWLPLGLGLLGLVTLSLGRAGTGWLGPRLALLTVLWFAITTVFSAGYGDGFVDRYYLGPLAMLSLWAAVGAAALLGAVSRVAKRLASWNQAVSRAVSPGLSALLVAAFLAYPGYRAAEGWPANDASRADEGARWGAAALAALEPNAVVVSWWSYSTNLWYEQYVLGRRKDVLVADDRVRLDEGWGGLPETIDRFLGQGRPVYLIPGQGWMAALGDRYRLEPIQTVPGYSSIWRVLR